MHTDGSHDAIDHPLVANKNKRINLRAGNKHLILLTNEATGSLLHNLLTKRTRHVWFIAVAFNGYVLRRVELLVRATTVDTFWICLRWALIASDRQNWIGANGMGKSKICLQPIHTLLMGHSPKCHHTNVAYHWRCKLWEQSVRRWLFCSASLRLDFAYPQLDEMINPLIPEGKAMRWCR